MKKENNNINGARPDCNYKSDNLPLQVIQTSIPFNVNQALGSVQMYTAMNYIANNMFGLDVRWFRAVPDRSTKDVIFNEYTLYNVSDEPMCIKVMIPDGTFPESSYKFDLMGMNYEVPLNVSIDVKYWKDVAGIDTMPQKGDIVYFPLNNKLYEVISVSDERGYMEQITAYKCSMAKYTPSANRKLGEDLSSTLDQYTFSTESVFGQEIKDDIQKLTDERQLSPKLMTSLDRFKGFDNELKVVNEPVKIHAHTVSDAYYDLTTSGNDIAVSYNHEPAVPKLASIYQNFRIVGDANRKYDVLDIIRDSNDKFQFRLKTLNRILIGQRVYFFRNNSKSINGYFIAEKVDGDLVTCTIPAEILKRLDSIKNDWFMMGNFKIDLHPVSKLLSADNFSIGIVACKYIEVVFNNQIEVFDINIELCKNQWYTIVTQLDFDRKAIGIILREPNPVYSPTIDASTARFNIIYDHGKISDISSPFEFKDFRLNKTNLHLSYTRVYDAIETEFIKQENELMTNLISSPDKAIILDNVETSTKALYVGAQR